MSVEKISSLIRDIKDFPKPGIIFKDITPVLKSPEIFAEIIEIMASRYRKNKPDYIVAIESRGFIFGSALAYELGCGIVPVRKKGKLPYKTIETSYELEYGTATVEMHSDALKSGDKVVLIDDLLATGGTAGASIRLIDKLGAKIIGVEFLVELAFLKGREHIYGLNVNSIVVVP
ncbi:MAG TPA: adenine phosphoribosyltransferase [Victivallales bacterium]|nr:adenine phosphoribosyltransferase [Victivallales bacterium]